MKPSLFLSALLVAGSLTVAFGAPPVRYDAKVWRAVQTYDVVSLSKSLDAHTRELIGVKFNFRGKDIRHLKPNWYECSIWQPIPGQNGKFADVPVMVAKPDLNAFKSIPTSSSGAEMTVYGRVEYEVDRKWRFLRLVGRNATVDAAGNATMSW